MKTLDWHNRPDEDFRVGSTNPNPDHGDHAHCPLHGCVDYVCCQPISDDAVMDNPDGDDGNDDEDVNPDMVIIPMSGAFVPRTRADKVLYRMGAHTW